MTIDPTISVVNYTRRTDAVRAALAALLRGMAANRAFFASLERHADAAVPELIRSLESAHNDEGFKAAAEDADIELLLTASAARELAGYLTSWAVTMGKGLDAAADVAVGRDGND